MAETASRSLLATLRARFDVAALSVTSPGHADRAVPPPTAAQAAQWAPLQVWCFLGAGDGSSPLFQPTRAPRVDQRFSVAVWAATTDPQGDVIEAFSRHLDGSHQLLAAGGAWAGLWLRLRVKARDVAWWRQRQPTDPWDCGYALDAPGVHAALARFQPRRATLVVAVDWPEEALMEAILAMARSSQSFMHPVRWLVVQDAPARPGDVAERLRAAGVAVQRLQPPDAER